MFVRDASNLWCLLCQTRDFSFLWSSIYRLYCLIYPYHGLKSFMKQLQRLQSLPMFVLQPLTQKVHRTFFQVWLVWRWSHVSEQIYLDFDHQKPLRSARKHLISNHFHWCRTHSAVLSQLECRAHLSMQRQRQFCRKIRITVYWQQKATSFPFPKFFHMTHQPRIKKQVYQLLICLVQHTCLLIHQQPIQINSQG